MIMNQETQTEKTVYIAPVLEQHDSYVVLTGVSLPIGSNVLDGETE
jgi:hypothetical protein